MNHFNQLSEFEKEFSRLSKKYSSLLEDLKKLERLIEINPTGFGKNFVVIHQDSDIKIIKARMFCKSLKDRSVRIIYAYNGDIFEFMYIEIYFKGDKENEDRERIKAYLNSIK